MIISIVNYDFNSFPFIPIWKRSWTEITFSQNLFRCPTVSLLKVMDLHFDK